MPKKKVKATKKSSGNNDTNARAILTLLVLLVAFGVYLLFNNYQDNLLNSPAMILFLILVFMLFGLLLALLYLINPQKRKR